MPQAYTHPAHIRDYARSFHIRISATLLGEILVTIEGMHLKNTGASVKECIESVYLERDETVYATVEIVSSGKDRVPSVHHAHMTRWFLNNPYHGQWRFVVV